MRPDPSQESPRWYAPAVVVVLIVAAGLRLWHLGTWSMWVDEGMTYIRATTGVLNDQGPMYATAPLNFLVTRWIIGMTGPGLFWLRLFPAICGIAGVGAVVWSARRLIGSVGSVVAGGLLAVSPWHIDWSQNARHFSAEFLFAVIAVTAFYEFWESGRLGWLVTSGVSAILGLLTHSSTLFVIGAMGLYAATLIAVPALRGAVVTRRKVIASALFFVVLIGGYAPVALTVSRYLGAHKTAWNSPGNVLASVLYYVGAVELVVASVTAAAASLRLQRAGILLLHWLVWPIACVGLAATRTISSGAYALPSLAAAVMLLGLLVDALFMAAPKWVAVAVAAGLAADVLVRTGLYFTVEHGNRLPWREAIAWTVSHAAPGDQIFASEGVVLGYYLGDDKLGRWLDRWSPPVPGQRQWLLVLSGDGVMDSPPLAGFVRDHCAMREFFPRNTGPKRRDVAVWSCDQGSGT